MTDMKWEYKKIDPEETFISFLGREATEEELWLGVQQGIVHAKRTGIEVVDLFASMVLRYMNHHAGFYATKLGVGVDDLAACLKVLSGRTTDEWIATFVWRSAKELLLQTDWSLAVIAEKTGFASLKSFSRGFIDRVGTPPSYWRKQHRAQGKECARR